ncbi:PASTA domain-containing protein [Candidatus Dependentiae bacterium]|nr:MAG: PASTA domain-containing protein [Candidatus Dependentiae bacterium]
MIISLKEYLWFLPFISFLSGYVLLDIMYRPKKLETPTLIGKQLKEAIALTSAHNLNLQLLEEREDPELPEGTIISQNPKTHSTIKSNQTIFCVISKNPSIITPNLISQNYETTLLELKKQGIHSNCYFLDSPYPKGFCFAQSPKAQTSLDTKSIILYISDGSTKPVLFPNLKNKSVNEVIDFLKPYNINPSIIHYPPRNPHDCDKTCIITDQRPLAGSLITLDPKKPPHVQLQVS